MTTSEFASKKSLLNMAEAANRVDVLKGDATILVEPIPFKAEPKSATEQGGEALLITVLLLAAAVIVLVWMKKKLGLPRSMAGLPASERLSVVEKIGIGTHSSILVVRWRNKEYLLARTENAVSKIDEFPIDVSPTSLQRKSSE
jgi:flagellar biogenesis protein FliO